MTEIYDKQASSKFWSKRLKSTTSLAAVLTYNAPLELNEVYDKWERGSLKKVLPVVLSGKKALDIGCGTGRISLTLAKLGAEVTGVDLSEAMLDRLEQDARKKRLLSNILPINSSSDDLPFLDKSFDIVTCFGLLEHLPQTVRRRTMFEAARVLKGNGKMFVVVNNDECVFLKGSYRMKRQDENGYFVTLVGIDWLESICKKLKLKPKVIAANPNYAAIQYMLSKHNDSNDRLNQVSLKKMLRLSLEQDLAGQFESDLVVKLGSHFLVEIRKPG
ncbi:MAG: class I SAM-dependent methyltransferase [candidate division Zixibacteria bacterium]